MKKYTLITIAILFSIITISQNKPWKTKGNNIGNNDFIGSKNNKSLIFKTNNFPRMKITMVNADIV